MNHLPICPILGLEVVGGVPAGVEDDDNVRSCDVESHAARLGRDEEQEHVRVGVELVAGEFDLLFCLIFKTLL